MRKKYLYDERRQETASEPVVDYEVSSFRQLKTMKSANGAASFEEEWERSLSVEQFREHCVARLREIYE